MPTYKKPESIINTAGYCGGCGHGIVQRLIAESIEELGLQDQVIACVDIACAFWSQDAMNFEFIAGPHGRCASVATGIKKVRPNRPSMYMREMVAPMSLDWMKLPMLPSEMCRLP